MKFLAAIPILLAVFAACSTSRGPARLTEPERQALSFLQREVPAWSRENGCFSCHNNGDAARALLAASQAGLPVSDDALSATLEWLATPERWDDNKGDPNASDPLLADVQFAAALAAAVEAGRLERGTALTNAARRVVRHQSPDGTWMIDGGNRVGSPATYGTTLATFMAWRTLMMSGLAEARPSIAKAETALRRVKPGTVPDTATVLWFSALERGAGTEVLRDEGLEFLRASQNGDGGWGPYADAPSEVFDTALAMLALANFRELPAANAMLDGGGKFLLAMQLGDGSWPATTRPSGGISYAQQMSTTGWATLALLATRPAVRQELMSAGATGRRDGNSLNLERQPDHGVGQSAFHTVE